MQQLNLIQSGCQQWIRQPSAIHQSQFAVSSSLAIYVHAADDFRLLKILALHDQHINAVCWSPVDAKLLACATSKQIAKVYQLDNEAVAYSTVIPGTEAVTKLCWSTHDEGVLLAHAGSNICCWPYARGDWHTLHHFRAPVSCMQQSATETRLLALGCADCSLHLYDLLNCKVLCTVKLDDGVVPCDVQFDPLSKQYMLLMFRNGMISMYGIAEDQQTLTQVHSMAKQPAAERSAAFVPSQPGNFMSISSKTGVLQLWNVSQQQPLRSMKAGRVPAQSIQFFPGTSKALLTFQDGTVKVFDISTQETLWSTQPGHTETIFDCCYAPHNHQLLATCSYDGSVRVWDTALGCCSKSLELPAGSGTSFGQHNQATVLYSVAWCPDGSQLAASSASGAVYLYDYTKGVVAKKWQIHNRMSLRVSWHPTEPNLLVSSGQDGVVIAFKTDGTKVRVLRHPSGAFGCAWHPTSKWVLATTSEAGPVYTWDLNIPGDGCLLQTLIGHSKKSFSVAWSPLLDNLLLSGGDDATARVWDVKAGTCVALLVGHKSEVRALCWHPEVPSLVFTGSWDSTIRAWDIRSQQCIQICHSHHGDVYGLSIHAACPSVMASVSRDTTVRLWDLKGLVAGLMVRCFLEHRVPRGQAGQYATHALPVMCGRASQELAEWSSHYIANNSSSSTGAVTADSLPVTGRIELFKKVSDFFCCPGAAHTLWQLAAAATVHLSAGQGSPTSATAGEPGGDTAFINVKPLPANESCGFQHMAATRQALISAANQLELSARGRAGAKVVSGGAAKKEEVLHEAALLQLQAGNLERCCDLLVEIDNWETALTLAPAVSQQYWCKLLQRRADAAAKAGAPIKQLLPMMLVSGQTTALIELLRCKEQFSTAANIAAVQACGGYQHFSGSKPQSSLYSPTVAGGPPSPTRLSTVTASPTQLNSPTRSIIRPASHQELGSPPALPPQQQPAQGLHPLLQRRTRESLPPLRVPGGLLPSASSLSPTAAVAAASADFVAAASVERSQSLGAALASPTTDDGSAAVVLNNNLSTAASVPARNILPRTSSNLAASFARMMSTNSIHGGSVVTDPEAVAQLTEVRSAQAKAFRCQGQPLLAACAALTISDVAAAVKALHLGNEPEQAAMLALALGQLGGVDHQLMERVYAALAIKCEAAGDWDAAAAATKLQSNAQHRLELLVVRQEHGSQGGTIDASSDSGRPGPADQGKEAKSYLRQHLGLKAAAHYAAIAETTSDALARVRCLLLAGNHAGAAAIAATRLQTLASQLKEQCMLPPPSSNGLQQQTLDILQLPQVQELLLWQECLESLDADVLVPTCWQEMFSYCLLAGSLRAFSYGYMQVGSYLMSSLRRWLEQHQVKGFPLCRAVLLILEAQSLSDVSPESSWSLLIAAADGAETTDNIRSAARQKLQFYPRTAAATDATAELVVATGSSLPSRAAGSGCSRSVISGRTLTGCPVRLLDDGASVVSLNEAVMLSHVMRTGPYGSGKKLQQLC